MNRKKKDVRYPHRIIVRVDEELYQKIYNGASAANISPSEYIRQVLRKGKTTVKQEIIAEVPQLKKLIAEFGKIGSNINQIAHYFNGGGQRTIEIEDSLMKALSQLFSMKFEVESMGGEFRGYSQTRLHQKQ